MTRNTKSVAIIGGGASGAIVLDTLVKEQAFDEIVLYERRDVLGGVWVLDENPDEMEEQIRWGLARYREKGDTRAYHTIDWGKKFEYWNLLTQLGGGVHPIGKAGRAFHVATQEEVELQNSIKERLLGFFSVDEGTIA